MITLRSSTDVIQARASARDLAREAGLGVKDQTRFATAVSELGRLALEQRAEAACELAIRSDDQVLRVLARVSLALLPGAPRPNVEAAGVRQMVDELQVTDGPEAMHLTVQIMAARRRPAPAGRAL